MAKKGQSSNAQLNRPLAVTDRVSLAEEVLFRVSPIEQKNLQVLDTKKGEMYEVTGLAASLIGNLKTEVQLKDILVELSPGILNDQSVLLSDALELLGDLRGLGLLVVKSSRSFSNEKEKNHQDSQASKQNEKKRPKLQTPSRAPKGSSKRKIKGKDT